NSPLAGPLLNWVANNPIRILPACTRSATRGSEACCAATTLAAARKTASRTKRRMVRPPANEFTRPTTLTTACHALPRKRRQSAVRSKAERSGQLDPGLFDHPCVGFTLLPESLGVARPWQLCLQHAELFHRRADLRDLADRHQLIGQLPDDVGR